MGPPLQPRRRDRPRAPRDGAPARGGRALHPAFAWDAMPDDRERDARGRARAPRASSRSPASTPTPRHPTPRADAPPSPQPLGGRCSAAARRLPELLGPEGGDLGSNSWVVSGALTESGLPLLANDPHLGPAMPSIWAQMGLHCAELSDDCPFDVAGFTLLRAARRRSSATTSASPGGSPTSAPTSPTSTSSGSTATRTNSTAPLSPLTLREETIEVAGGDPVTITVRSTARGPLVTDIGADFAAVAERLPRGIRPARRATTPSRCSGRR